MCFFAYIYEVVAKHVFQCKEEERLESDTGFSTWKSCAKGQETSRSYVAKLEARLQRTESDIDFWNALGIQCPPEFENKLTAIQSLEVKHEARGLFQRFRRRGAAEVRGREYKASERLDCGSVAENIKQRSVHHHTTDVELDRGNEKVRTR